ncbi:hypothetical protein ABEB36_005115 [Hypothenemus hampei]|uniref:Uncharacterized protein n=1 Tax=Hypothenemus hampei TaxID=57062 RepID=A0ABD1EX32_HYPHA
MEMRCTRLRKELFPNRNNPMRMGTKNLLHVPQTVEEEQEITTTEPLRFDLSQPTSFHNFDSFIGHNSNVEFFQNMSPPSLVNSLCSSTFANLMESSFIKNDPILSEIRDKDYTESVLLQDMEAPMFQSITESCSSINSDTPESFLKKVTRDGTFRRNASEHNITFGKVDNFMGNQRSSNEFTHSTGNAHSDVQNATFALNATNLTPQSVCKNSTGNFNGTYRRILKHNGTFKKSDLKHNQSNIEQCNLTNVINHGNLNSIENDMNSSNKGSLEDVNSTLTKPSGDTVILRKDSLEDLKKRLSSSDGSDDLNRIEDKDTDFEESFTEMNLNKTIEIKRTSLGSTDSLDRMSSLSGSSKGSSKVLSTEDVRTVVDMQKRNMKGFMSTPKVRATKLNIWDNNFISPITGGIVKTTYSDSDLSDEYKSVKSSASKVTLETWTQPIRRNMEYIAPPKDIKIKTNTKSLYTSTGQKPLPALPTHLTSYQNVAVKNTVQQGSHQNWNKPVKVGQSANVSNLNTMGTKLKGSYTSLKPISTNLPVVPPIGSTFNGTETITRPSAMRSNTVPTTKPNVPILVQGGEGIKPVRASGLPRPTGIPRPSSRIPGPRTNNLRPATSSRNVNY